MRCFVAVELEQAARDALTRLLRACRADGRDVTWTAPDKLHVTLRFLGEVEDAHLPAVCEIVQRVSASHSPFSIALTALGAFPSTSRPRVLWCGVSDPTRGCAAWAREAEPHFQSLGFAPETRDYHPHVTLGRARSPQGSSTLRRLLETPPEVEPWESFVEEIVLFSSDMDRRGLVYTPLLRVPLS